MFSTGLTLFLLLQV